MRSGEEVHLVLGSEVITACFHVGRDNCVEVEH